MTLTNGNVANAYIQLSSSHSKVDAENVKTLQKNGANQLKKVEGSEEDYSSIEENTFTRKMTDASAHEKKLMKKLEMIGRENELL
jgi:hypothetical protein